MATKDETATAKRKPPNAGIGRKKGVPNKTTQSLKEAILLAAEDVGSDGNGKGGLRGYCRFLAMQEPKTFGALMGRVLPLQIAGADGSDLAVSFTTVLLPRPEPKTINGSALPAKLNGSNGHQA